MSYRKVELNLPEEYQKHVKTGSTGLSRKVYFQGSEIGTVYNDGDGYKFCHLHILGTRTGTTIKCSWDSGVNWVLNQAHKKHLLDAFFMGSTLVEL